VPCEEVPVSAAVAEPDTQELGSTVYEAPQTDPTEIDDTAAPEPGDSEQPATDVEVEQRLVVTGIVFIPSL